MQRTSGTYNQRQDATAWVQYEGKHLTLKNITWGTEAKVRILGREFTFYEDMSKPRLFTRIFDWLETRFQNEQKLNDRAMSDLDIDDGYYGEE